MLVSARKVMLIGVDGAPFDLVTKLASQGELPNIHRLIKEGAYGVLESLIDNTPPAWSSIYTGKNAGKHGIFDFLFHKTGTYEFVPVNASMRDSEDLWEILSRESIRVGVINAPLSFPPRPVNGFMVSGFLTPGKNAQFTYPESLKREIWDVVPGFEPSTSDELLVQLRKDVYLRNVGRRLENLRKASTHLFSKHPCEFFTVVISETDHVQHWFWDPTDGGGIAAKGNNANVILDTYRRVDRIIGELRGLAADAFDIMIVSDHGGGPLRRYFHTNYFLHTIGMLNFKDAVRTRLRRFLYKTGITYRLYEFLLSRNIYWLRPLLQPITMSMSDVDWTKTYAFSLGSGQIYLNLKGREPEGLVPKEKYEEIRRLIIEELKKVRDPKGNNYPIQRVYTREALFSGPHLDEAPDIQFLMIEGYDPFPWSSIAGTVFTRNIDRTGTHTPRGIVIVKGTGVSPGLLTKTTVLDIAPTILYMMRVPIPSDMDGQVITQAFTQEYLETNPILFANEKQKPTQRSYELSKEEQSKLEENLRSLGYI